MFDYLVNYGIQKHSFNYEDLDVNDRMALQDQINRVRSDYSQLLQLLDDIQGKILDCNERLSRRSKEIIASAGETRRINSLLNQDDDYLATEAEQQALKTGASMVNAQIEFCKNDLRILNSVFYNKF